MNYNSEYTDLQIPLLLLELTKFQSLFANSWSSPFWSFFLVRFRIRMGDWIWLPTLFMTLITGIPYYYYPFQCTIIHGEFTHAIHYGLESWNHRIFWAEKDTFFPRWREKIPDTPLKHPRQTGKKNQTPNDTSINSTDIPSGGRYQPVPPDKR